MKNLVEWAKALGYIWLGWCFLFQQLALNPMMMETINQRMGEIAASGESTLWMGSFAVAFFLTSTGIGIALIIFGVIKAFSLMRNWFADKIEAEL